MKVTKRIALVILVGTLICSVIVNLGTGAMGMIFLFAVLGFTVMGSVVSFKLLNDIYVDRGEEILYQWKSKVDKEEATTKSSKKVNIQNRKQISKKVES